MHGHVHHPTNAPEELEGLLGLVTHQQVVTVPLMGLVVGPEASHVAGDPREQQLRLRHSARG